MKEALQLFEGTPPSVDHAMAWLRYSNDFLLHGQRARPEEILTSLNRALEIAEAADAATVIPQILCLLALESFLRGEVREGFRLLAHARSEPEGSRDAWAVISLAIVESDVLLKAGRLRDASRVGLGGFEDARQLGVENTFSAAISLSNAVEGLLGRGCTAEAAAVIDSRTTGPVDRDHWPLHQARAEIDLLRGDVDSAAKRLRSIETGASSEFVRDVEQDVAEVALWAGRPEEALEAIRRALDRQEDTNWVILCGWLLALGMRACAELAERARALRDHDAVRAALAAADDLAAWVRREHNVPFTDHPFVATIPAVRATWDAERGRAGGANDPAGWNIAAEQWETLGFRHRVAYARWRQAEALLALATSHGRGTAATALSTAAEHANQHVPLIRAIEDLARRARVDLNVLAEQAGQDEPQSPRAFGLTDRELDVLRLLGLGKTNPEIAAALFISPRTASVHVTHILRKLDATTRVQAATIAERAGLLATEPTPPSAT
jgi:DNA-binding CsgD family transcriptional regulator